MGEWFASELENLQVSMWFAGPAMVVAWPAAWWSLIAAVVWCARPAGRVRLVSRYPLRTITWLMCAPLIIVAVLAGLVLLNFGWWEPLVPVVVAGCVAAIVAAHSVVPGRSVRAAVVMIVIGALGLQAAAWFLVMVPNLVWWGEYGPAVVVLLPWPVLVAGAINGIVALVKATAPSPAPGETAVATMRLTRETGAAIAAPASGLQIEKGPEGQTAAGS